LKNNSIKKISIDKIIVWKFGAYNKLINLNHDNTKQKTSQTTFYKISEPGMLQA